MELIAKPEHQSHLDATDGMYPCEAHFWTESGTVGTRTGSIYGYCLEGRFIISNSLDTFEISEGNYFAMSGMVSFDDLEDNSKLWTVTRYGFKVPTQVGRVEKNGRLSYIDGCSDSVLVSMPRYGDPVLNYLHFPEDIYQTQHTHPSVRLGVVISGEGTAFRDETAQSQSAWRKPLTKGCIFMLEEQELHSFCTDNSHMDIIAFHPDSDTGPTDENHSMINRTYIDHGK